MLDRSAVSTCSAPALYPGLLSRSSLRACRTTDDLDRQAPLRHQSRPSAEPVMKILDISNLHKTGNHEMHRNEDTLWVSRSELRKLVVFAYASHVCAKHACAQAATCSARQESRLVFLRESIIFRTSGL